MPNEMPEGGAKELRNSADGRRYLQELQKKHALDILQPGDPKFDRVYGDKIKKQEAEKQRIAKESSDLYAIEREKKAHEEFKKTHVNPKYL
jgi:hypothetical protein